jgi:gluconolactonase
MDWEFDHLVGGYRTEGVAWDGEGVLFTDVENSEIRRYDPETGDCTVFRSGTSQALRVHCDAAGRVYACETGAGRVVRYEPDGSVTVLADAYDGRRLNGPSDLAFDDGRLWVSDANWGDRGPGELDHRSVYRLDEHDGAWTVRRATYDTTKPNPLLVSRDGTRLYVGTSQFDGGTTSSLRAYPIRADGELGDPDVIATFDPHRGVDGMCLDEDGNVVAVGGWEESSPGPLAYVFAPDGRLLETHPLPCDRPTYCAFGGADRRTLYVTGATDLYRARIDRAGYAR